MSTILVVDDRLENREYLLTVLGYGGHRVLEAADGAQALQLARVERPDLVITDLLMPTMDGYEFAQQLRASPDPAIARAPIIFYTATYNPREARALAQSAGVGYVLTKPSEPPELLEMVAKALNHDPAPALSQSEPLPQPAAVLAGKIAQKVGELDSLARRLSDILELGLRFAHEREPNRLLQALCDAARELSGARYAAIAMPGDEGQSLRHFVTSGLEAATVARIGPPPVAHGLLGRVLATRQPLRLPAVVDDPAAAGFPPGHPPMRSFLGVPIASASHFYGQLYLTDKLQAPEFSQEDEHVALALSAQVAVAYENALQYDEIQRHAARLQLALEARRKALEALQAKTEELAATTQQLWQSAKLATMGELTSSVAHELNNPLFTVSLHVEVMLADLPPDDPQRSKLQIIQGEVERMSRLVATLLQFGRRSTRQVSTFDVREELSGTLALMDFHWRPRRVQVAQELSPVAPVEMDRQQFRQVLLNLMTNAADALPRGGTVSVRTWMDDGHVCLELADTGDGIPPTALAKIWEPFFTTKPEGQGTGLGLPICRRIVQEHGGTIEIASAGVPGQGTQVRLTLPAAPGHPHAGDPQPAG